MIGRKRETRLLKEALNKDEAQLIAVYGRRRIGKTYLVREAFEGNFYFSHAGVANDSLAGELAEFRDSLIRSGAGEVPRLNSWREAFNELERFIAAGGRLSKKVIFIDELPWMDTPKSGFVRAFETFWNGWCSARKDVVLVICGSVSSWIVKNVFRNRGGLYNRVTRQICLQPFTLEECRETCAGLGYSEYDIAELYMVFGGVPYYWKMLEKGDSAAQAVDRLCFEDNAPLRLEYRELYSSLFGMGQQYDRIIRTLSARKCGMLKSELVRAAGLEGGGNANRYLDALEQCGFLRRFTAFGKKKHDVQYQLVDNFTIFHLQFMDGEANADPHFFQHAAMGASLNAWRGYAFERVCLQHLPQIKKALGISGVLTKAYSWRHVPDETWPVGVQIDLLIERADNVVNVCEIKYSRSEFAIDREYARRLREKAETFRGVTRVKSAIHITLITAGGLVRNAYWGTVQSEVSLDDLFEAAEP